MKKIAILASGSGSNAERIALYFKAHPKIEVSLILTNRKEASVLGRCERLGIPALYFNKALFASELLPAALQGAGIDLIVLAGFLWKVPQGLLDAYPDRIVNIHPALLPKYGGKGMYGRHVHEAVKAAGDQESGITIHLVNENYDEGAVVFQERIAIAPSDSPEDIAAKVQQLEHEHFPRVIEKLLAE